jgi:arylsulfatase A-like enzyme
MRPVETPPDILWILTTQWRWQSSGFAGDLDAATPYMDAFAERGIVFTQAFANHPFGPFARALLLTGVTSPENGVSDYWDPLPRSTQTIAHRLGSAGYSTAFFGKWHLAARDPKAPLVGETHARQIVAPADRGGFVFWEGFESGFLLNDPWLHGTRLPEPKQFTGYQADILCSRCGEWLDERSPGPRFTVVSLEAPHPPYAAPVPNGIPVREPESLHLAPNVPRGGNIETTARLELSGYLRHLQATDRAIGRLLQHVNLQHTAVFITSVHGDMHGAHGLFRKGWPYEESVRIPLLAHWPGCTHARIHTPACLADLPATSLALAGLNIPPAWPGQDLRQLPADSDRVITLSMPSAPPFPHQCPQPWGGYRSRDEMRVSTWDGQPWLWFNLRSDPWQLRNLVASAGEQPQ